ncbi:hypothetical protein WAI453_006873 [Rhynchosporium graminicola]
MTKKSSDVDYSLNFSSTVPNCRSVSAEACLKEEKKKLLTLPKKIEDSGGLTAMKWNLKSGKIFGDADLQMQR